MSHQIDSSLPFKSLRTWLTRQVAMLSVIVAIAVSCTIILGLQLTRQRIQNRLEHIGIAAQHKIDLFITRIETDLVASGTALSNKNDPALIFSYLRAQHPCISDIILTDAENTVIAQRSTYNREHIEQFSRPSWLSKVPPFGTVVVGPLEFEGQTPFIIFSATVNDDIGLPRDILYARASLDEIWNMILDIKVGQSGYAYLTDSTGNIMVSRNQRFVATRSTLTTSTGRTNRHIAGLTTNIYKGLYGRPVIATTTRLSALPWYAFVEQPVTEAFAGFVILAGILLMVIAGMILLLLNIIRTTHRRIVEPLIALRDSEARYRLIADNTADVIWVLNPQTRTFNYVSPSVLRLRGFSQEEVMAQTLAESLTPESAALIENNLMTIEQRYADIAPAGGPTVFEMNQPHKNGSVVSTEVTTAVLRNTRGEIEIVGVSRDITERKQAQKALYESNELLSLFIKESPIYAFIKAVHPGESRVVFASENFKDMIGIPGSVMAGKTMHELFPADFATKITDDDWNVVSGERILQLEEQLNDKNYLTIKFPIKQDGRYILAGYTIDITERRRTEEILNNTQKLESLGILAGGIAHDFNNLLGGIYGYIDLAEEIAAEPQLKQYLAKAMASIDRGRDLTRQLITFAKGGTPIRQVGHLFPFVRDTTQFALSGSNVSCTVDPQPGLWACNFDKNQIGQVIDNIIINAKQAMPDGGNIEITAVNITLDSKQYAALEAGDYIRISIRDHGIGMPREILPRIFDPFYTTKATGHGLGLATCYSIIRRHGGVIDVESEPGKGSTFHVILPAISENVELPGTATASKFTGDGMFVVMDDEKIMRDVMSGMLSLFGYTVIAKPNGQETIEFIAAEYAAGRNIAGAMLDLTIPGSIGGKEVLVELRKYYPTLPIFAVSGHAEDPIIARPEEYGFSGSICKPFKTSELADLLRRHMPLEG